MPIMLEIDKWRPKFGALSYTIKWSDGVTSKYINIVGCSSICLGPHLRNDVYLPIIP